VLFDQRLSPVKSATRLAVWVVLLVLCLGTTRSLVICTGPHCEGRIEVLHAGGSCCEHAHDQDADDSHGPAISEGCGRCVDVALGIGVGPVPERLSLDEEAPCCWLPATSVVPRSPDLHAVVLQPPATGPPRTDQRTGLRASTLLLI
jgi:hypothetical protein